MCGICGFFGRRDPALLRAMTGSLRHRGPDDDGFFETDAASLGFRRLAIIDLTSGAQPMSTARGRLQLVYNGEIYNYRELRNQLERVGRRFRTQSDTEVALQAYAEWGPQAFRRFNGMWAMAFLDRRGPAPQLVLCRDHFGIKPLFYAEHNRRVVFASEIKAILQDPGFPRRVDEQQLYEYLGHGLYDHNEQSFFAGIRQVPAATYLSIDADGIRPSRYWTPVLSEDAEPDPGEFRRLFTRAVERRLVSDVPVGTCLSGGLDSSAIVCVMDGLLQQHVPDSVALGDRLKTFSAIFPSDPIDERRYIEAVLAVTSAEPTWVTPTSDRWLAELESWVWHAEEPMITTAPYAMWTVMRAAREKVTVLLDGQAGDELLAGYVPYQYVYLRQLLRERRHREFSTELARSRDTLGPLVRRRLWERRHAVDVHALLRSDWVSDRERPRDPRVQDDLKRRLLQDLTTFSLPSLLRYEDRNSMAHSMESRLPFLDQELVAWILRLPASAIVSQGWSRRILREALRDVLPEPIRLRRRKIGFTTPEFRWFRQQRSSLQSLLRSPSFRSRRYWNAEAVAEGFRRACLGETEESLFFWRAMNVELWLRVYFDAAAPDLAVGTPYGFALRADRAASRALSAEKLVEMAAPNPGRHLLLESDGATWARLPLRAALVEGGDDIGEVLWAALAEAQGKGVTLQDGDVVAVSEKVVAITQGRSLPISEIMVTPTARLLSRFVRRVPVGIGLGRPQTMQLAVEEAGAGRVLLAAACAAVTRPLGLRGVFYRVAGARVASIDGPTAHTIPPYNTHASKAPRDPDGVAERLRRTLEKGAGRDVEVAVVDTNDLAADVLGASAGVNRAAVSAALADNPLGQTDEQTPFCIIRRLVR
ncbi:MAG: asparagine synthase (glutamine-hydrolyzing) [Candidatus Dormiibacterota bacterium]